MEVSQLKTIEEFQEYYDKELTNDLFELEDLRKKSLSKLNNFYFILSVTLIPVVILLYVLFLYDLDVSAIIFFILACIVYIRLYSRSKNEYTEAFINLVIPKILSFINDTLRLFPGEFISKEKFMESGIFLEEPNSYFGKNLISGKINNVNVRLSEVYAQYNVELDPEYMAAAQYDNEHNLNEINLMPEKTLNEIQVRTRHSYSIFSGLFFIADFNRKFRGKTFVLPDLAEKSLGHLGVTLQRLNDTHGQMIKLEDPVFENQFAVYGSDQIAARYILTTSFMERITNFKNKLNKNIYISFIDSKLCIAIEDLYLDINPDINASLLEFETLENYFEILLFVEQLVEDLNLSANINEL